MKVSLARQLSRFVKEQVKSGRYVDESEVVRDALRRMEAQAVLVGNQELGTLDDADIMAMVFLVLMEAAKSAEEDLKAIMAQVNAINAAKCRLRHTIDKLSTGTSRDVEDELTDTLDSLSEMGEMESLRFQMAMDRLSKLMSTLSNILKKKSNTAQSITQNLK
jgi:putative addiction module CopG family antidote